MAEPLGQIFAVTVNGSLYKLLNEREVVDGMPVPAAQRLAARPGTRSRRPAEQVFTQGMALGITRKGVISYDLESPEELAHPTSPEKVPHEWRQRTSPIVGLFLEEDDATQCLRASNLTECDPRWRGHTARTLRAILEADAPVFVVAKEGDLAFPPEITDIM